MLLILFALVVKLSYTQSTLLSNQLIRSAMIRLGLYFLLSRSCSSYSNTNRPPSLSGSLRFPYIEQVPTIPLCQEHEKAVMG